MMISVVQVPNNLVTKLWPQVVPHMEKGRKYWEDFYDIEDFLTASIKGDMQLWLFIRDKKVSAVVFTSLLVYPKGTYLRYLYAGGNGLRVFRSYAYVMENWAKSRGAIGWELLGRDGWQKQVDRVLSKKGPVFKGSYFCAKFGD